MGAKLAQIVKWVESKSKIPSITKARINLIMQRDITTNPHSIPDDPKTISELKDAIMKVLNMSNSEQEELKKIIGDR